MEAEAEAEAEAESRHLRPPFESTSTAPSRWKKPYADPPPLILLEKIPYSVRPGIRQGFFLCVRGWIFREGGRRILRLPIAVCVCVCV